MLNEIHIKHFTIIDELDLDFKNGLTVLTGETGAGKSIIIDAIELALGKRITHDIIKHGKNRADISIAFDIQNNLSAQTYLKNLEIEHDGTCIIRRTIDRDGRTKSFINSIPMTLQSVKALGEMLVNIHGQHEFQTLLHHDSQRQLLDDFANHEKFLESLKIIYKNWKNIKGEFENLQHKIADSTTRTEFLTYQINEIDKLNLVENEIEAINLEHKQLSNADLLLNNCQTTLDAITDHEEQSALIFLTRAQQALNTIKDLDPALLNSVELLDNSMIQIQEASDEISHYIDRIDLNPERLSWLDQRLADIHSIARKHHVQPNELYELHQKMRDELEQLENSDEHLEKLKRDLIQIEKNYFDLAKKLSDSRKKAAKKLSQFVTQNLQQLGMQGGKFEITFEPRESQQLFPTGLEKVSFIVSANPGQPLQLLSQVASGGELSRISLAIQVITAKHSPTPSLIFDEADSGIGGAVAEIVGNLLRELGQDTQVLSITHLAQVAARSDHHLVVQKKHVNNNTITSISYLDNAQKIFEIARMIGGVKISEQTIAHAKEMLKK